MYAEVGLLRRFIYHVGGNIRKWGEECGCTTMLHSTESSYLKVMSMACAIPSHTPAGGHGRDRKSDYHSKKAFFFFCNVFFNARPTLFAGTPACLSPHWPQLIIRPRGSYRFATSLPHCSFGLGDLEAADVAEVWHHPPAGGCLADPLLPCPCLAPETSLRGNLVFNMWPPRFQGSQKLHPELTTSYRVF